MTKQTKEALWPFKKGLPSQFTVPQKCLCDTFGLACTDGPPVQFEKLKDGQWKVNGKVSPLTDEQATLLLKRCDIKEAAIVKTTPGKNLHYPLEVTKLTEQFVTWATKFLEKNGWELYQDETLPTGVRFLSFLIPLTEISLEEGETDDTSGTHLTIYLKGGEVFVKGLYTLNGFVEVDKDYAIPPSTYHQVRIWKKSLGTLRQAIKEFVVETNQLRSKTAQTKTAGDRTLDDAINGLHPEAAKKLKSDPALQKHAKTVVDYYGGPLAVLCQQIPVQRKKLKSVPLEAVAWALQLPGQIAGTYETLAQGATYTSQEMVKYLAKQKSAQLQVVALQAPKIEIDPGYQQLVDDLGKQVPDAKAVKDTVKLVNVMPVTQKQLTGIFERLVKPTEASCKRFMELQGLIDTNPLMAISEALSGALLVSKEHTPLASKAPKLKENLSKWFNQIFEQLSAGNMSQLQNVKLSIDAAAQVKPSTLRKVLAAVVKELRSVDWGQPAEGQLSKLEKVSDALAKVGIKPVDVDLAISSWAKGRTEEAQNFINGPSGRGTNKGALGDLMPMLENLKTGAPEKPSPTQVAQKLLGDKSFKDAVKNAETEEALADAILGSLSSTMGEELLTDEKYVQTILTEVVNQLGSKSANMRQPKSARRVAMDTRLEARIFSKLKKIDKLAWEVNRAWSDYRIAETEEALAEAGELMAESISRLLNETENASI